MSQALEATSFLYIKEKIFHNQICLLDVSEAVSTARWSPKSRAVWLRQEILLPGSRRRGLLQNTLVMFQGMQDWEAGPWVLQAVQQLCHRSAGEGWWMLACTRGSRCVTGPPWTLFGKTYAHLLPLCSFSWRGTYGPEYVSWKQKIYSCSFLKYSEYFHFSPTSFYFSYEPYILPQLFFFFF